MYSKFLFIQAVTFHEVGYLKEKNSNIHDTVTIIYMPVQYFYHNFCC